MAIQLLRHSASLLSLLLLTLLDSYSQSFGLGFNGNDFVQDKRTGLNLFPGKAGATGKGVVELRFDMSFEPGHFDYFGNIVRIVLNNKQNIDLLYDKNPAMQEQFRFIIGDAVAPIPIKIDTSRLFSAWTSLRIVMDIEKGKFLCYRDQQQVVSMDLALQQTDSMRVFFGAYHYGNFYSTDVPAMVIRDINVLKNRKTNEHFPLDERTGNLAYTADRKATGQVENPVWIRNRYYAWRAARSFSLKGPAFKPGSANYKEMADNRYLLDGVKALDGIVYDPFNPGAAALYWKQIARDLIPTQIDGWFLDGPEPDNIATFLQSTTFLGPAPKVRNLFPLFHSTNFYRGITHEDPLHRHYLLTRCAWAGQQKNGTAIWSGDIPTTFDELKKQVTAGLNFTATGIPYWTTDIGGYSGGNPADPVYQELFVRWWQYGTFCPVFRAHGRRYPGDTKGPNELWAFGSKVQQIGSACDELRYRLMPYIYSLSEKVTWQHYTPMRLLAFDFPDDTAARNTIDQFMYGPAFLVCPVTEAGATSRKVYLPQAANWIDYWTGQSFTGGQTITAAAPLDKMPLFVKSGSIIPLAPLMQYTDERLLDTVELHIYPGAEGDFELYEDDSNTTAYQREKYSIIPLSWNDETQTLTIGRRTGNYPGMVANRMFRIVIAGKKERMAAYNGAIKKVVCK